MDMDLETQQHFVPSGNATTTTNPISCNALDSLLSFSCRARAESFARKLQLKLKNLGVTTEQSGGQTVLMMKPSESLASAKQYFAELSSEIPVSDERLVYSNNNNVFQETTTTIAGQGSSSSSDSDYYFDFDIGSPGSPIENGSCYTVINPCDDICCKECLSVASCTKSGCQNQSNIKSSYENGMESGCVVSSPATTSPDNNFSSEKNNKLNVFEPSNGLESLKVQDEEEVREGSLDIPDGSSDASDSIYYDVESFSSSPKMLCEGISAVVDSSFETDPSLKEEPLCILIQSASLDSIDATDGQKQINEPVLTVDVTQDSLKTSYEPQLLSPSSDDEFINDRPRIQRSSSLKTGKTPPGTPGRKKIVRFADVLGLDLADVRTFLDEIPNVPKSAFDDLKDAMELAGITDPTAQPNHPRYCKPNKTLLPSFHQPVSMPDYFDKIRDQKVLLENAFLVENFTIKGTVRVKNMDFHKSVYIRYSYNDWRNFTDFMTTYVSGSCDGFSDKFEFTIPLSPNSVEVGGRVSFACRFHCQGQQFWDNNCGRNYIFHCVPSSSQGQQNHLDFHLHSPSTTDHWASRMWM